MVETQRYAPGGRPRPSGSSTVPTEPGVVVVGVIVGAVPVRPAAFTVDWTTLVAALPPWKVSVRGVAGKGPPPTTMSPRR